MLSTVGCLVVPLLVVPGAAGFCGPRSLQSSLLAARVWYASPGSSHRPCPWQRRSTPPQLCFHNQPRPADPGGGRGRICPAKPLVATFLAWCDACPGTCVLKGLAPAAFVVAISPSTTHLEAARRPVGGTEAPQGYVGWNSHQVKRHGWQTHRTCHTYSSPGKPLNGGAYSIHDAVLHSRPARHCLIV